MEVILHQLELVEALKLQELVLLLVILLCLDLFLFPDLFDEHLFQELLALLLDSLQTLSFGGLK